MASSRNLLFIGKRLPLFDHTAAHRRLFEMLRLLHGMGHHVTYAADLRAVPGDDATQAPGVTGSADILPAPASGRGPAGSRRSQWDDEGPAGSRRSQWDDEGPAGSRRSQEAAANGTSEDERLVGHVARYIAALRSIGADLMLLLADGRCLHAGQTGRPQPVPWPRVMADLGFDTVVLIWDDLAARHIADVRAYLPHSAVVVDSIDLGFLRHRRELALAPGPDDEAILTREQNDELATYRAADMVITVTETERRTLQALAPDLRRVVVLPTIHNPIAAPPPFAVRDGFLFVGNLTFAPNIDAVRWLHDELIDRLRAYLPRAEITIVGGGLTPQEAENLTRPGMRLAGHVPETALYLAHTRVSLAPLRFGAGIKGKVGEALACGVPVTATTIAAEGMDLQHGVHALIADDAEAFACQAARLHEDEALWQRLSDTGRQHAARYGDAAATRQLVELLDATAHR